MGDTCGRQLADHLTTSLLPRWLRIAGALVALYLPLFLIFGFVYDWDFVVGAEAACVANDLEGLDAMFLSVLLVTMVGVWLGLSALGAAPIALMRLVDRGALFVKEEEENEEPTPDVASATSLADEHGDESSDPELPPPLTKEPPAAAQGTLEAGAEELLTSGDRTDDEDGTGPLRRAIASAEQDRYVWMTRAAVVLGALGIYVAFWFEAWGRTKSTNPIWVGSFAGEFDWPSAVAVVLWVPVGAIVLALFARVYVMISITNEAAYDGLNVLVGHPDGAAGLKPLGNQLLRGLIIGAAPATWASVWVIILAAEDLSENMAALSDRWLSALRFIFLPLFVLIIYPIAVRPILHVRSKMQDKNRELHVSGDRLSRTIHEEAIAAVAQRDVEGLSTGQDRVESLQKLYERLFPLPTWPFDRTGVVKFVAVLAPSVLSISGLGNAIVKILEAALSTV